MRQRAQRMSLSSDFSSAEAKCGSTSGADTPAAAAARRNWRRFILALCCPDALKARSKREPVRTDSRTVDDTGRRTTRAGSGRADRRGRAGAAGRRRARAGRRGAGRAGRRAEGGDFYLVGLIGGKDVGKSALVNALAGRNITAITSHGPGTEVAVAYAHASQEPALRELLERRGAGAVPDRDARDRVAAAAGAARPAGHRQPLGEPPRSSRGRCCGTCCSRCGW